VDFREELKKGANGTSDGNIAPLSMKDRSASAPPDHSPTDDTQSIDSRFSQSSPRRNLVFSLDKDAALSSRVSQATGVAREMLKTRLNNYLARRQQAKLERQILTKDRDLLVNSTKPRTQLPSDSAPNIVVKDEDEDIDSGPLPFETKKPPIFAPNEFMARSPEYGPSAMMTIPSTMANARPPSPGSETPVHSPLPPALPPRSPAVKRPVPPPPLPNRSSPRPIPRRPTPKSSYVSQNVGSPDEYKTELNDPENTQNQNDDDELLILHIPSDEGEDMTNTPPSIEEFESSPVECPKGRKPLIEEEAVLEPSSYGSNRSRRTSAANELAPQWSEKRTTDRDMPEIMEQGLMG
jgi:hypothetical protein